MIIWCIGYHSFPCIIQHDVTVVITINVVVIIASAKHREMIYYILYWLLAKRDAGDGVGREGWVGIERDGVGWERWGGQGRVGFGEMGLGGRDGGGRERRGG